MPRFERASRLALALTLFGLLPLSSGCSGEGEAPTPQQTQQIQKDESDARKKAYGGNTGVPVGKKAMENASKQ